MGGRALVVGAEVVGTACALHLRRDEWDVTLLDRGAPAEAASRGNAGHLGIASVIPQATPAQVRAIPRLLRDADTPLTFRWPYVLRNLPWFVRFVANGRVDRMEANARALAALLERVPATWDAMAREVAADDLIARTGLLHAWRGEAAMRASAWAFDLRRRFGERVEDLGAEEARAAEPALTGEVAGERLLPDVPTASDPLELTRGLVARPGALGGRVERVAVRAMRGEGDAVRRIETDRGGMEADLVVLSASGGAACLARPFGARVPLAAERGYHIMVCGTNTTSRLPLLLAEARVAVTPMRGGLRLTTMAEFAEPDAAPDHDRAARVIGQAAGFLPGVGLHADSRCMRPRPSTPDSLPVIGRAPRAANLLLAYGHGHLSMTLAGVTGEAVADLAAGRAARTNLSACAPDRRAA